MKKSEWKNTKIWKAKGKAVDTNTRGSPGYQSQPNSLETHLVRKWGDIGHQRTLSPWIDGWMDGLQEHNYLGLSMVLERIGLLLMKLKQDIESSKTLEHRYIAMIGCELRREGIFWILLCNIKIINVFFVAQTGMQMVTAYNVFTLFQYHICMVCGSFQCPYCDNYNSEPHTATYSTNCVLLCFFISYFIQRFR